MSGFRPSDGDTYLSTSNQVGVTQTSHLNGDGSLTLTKDENASQGAIPITSVHINSHTDNVQTTVSFGGGAPQSVFATQYNITLNGLQTLNDVFLLGLSTDGNEALIASQSIPGAALVVSTVAQTFGTINETFTPAFAVACFAAGTRITTPDGEVAVEALREGQRVVMASGETAPVVWLGHHVADCRTHPRAEEVWPIRIAAGAFGDKLPVRDLALSPDHAVLVDGVLVPARYLVNGSSITRQQVEEVTYWHVELPEHGALLAEGLPCESYLDTGNRAAFEHGAIRFASLSYAVRASA
jgi:hypothetical protein